jgi:nucleoprotein TPR
MESQACEASRSNNAELAALRTDLAHLKQHLKSEVDGSARSRDVLESQLNQAMNEVKQLKQDLEKAVAELANRSMDLDGMSKLLNVKDRELNVAKDSNERMSAELADLKGELTNALNNVEKLCSDFDREMKKMALLTQDNNSISDLLKEERARVKDLTKSLHQANGEVQDFKVQVQRAKQDASAAAEHIADLETRSLKLMEEAGEERGVSAKLRVEIAQLTAEIEKSTKRMVSLVSECGETKEEIRTLQAEISGLKGQLGEKDDLAAKDLNNVLNDLDTERKINERIRGEMNSLKNEAALEREATVVAERNVAKVSKDMEELQSEMDRIVRRLDSTQESNNELRKALETEKELSKKLTTESSAEHARGDALTVDLAKAHVALQDLHRQVDFMKSQLNSTKEAGTSVESMLNTEIDRLNTDLTSRNMENKEMSANIQRLNSELSNIQAANAQLQEANDKLTDQVSEERAKVSAGQRELAIANSQIERVNAEIKRLQNEMKDHPREKAEMRSAMDAALAERDAAIQTRDSIRQLVAKLKAQVEMLLSDLDEQKNSNDALCDEITSLQAQLAEANKLLLAAEEDAKKAWGKVVMLEDRIANMQEELDSLNVTRNALGRLELSTKDGLHSVFEMAKTFENHKAKLMKELDRLETEIRSIHKNEMEAYDEIIDLKRQLDNNGGDLEKEHRKLEMALQREAEQANTILALRTENDKLSRQLEKHKQMLADEQQRAENLKLQADDAHSEHQKLAKDHARALEACRKMHDAVCRDNPCSDQGGVGIQIAEHESGEISIMTLYPGPARNCGKMASGDVVLSVDGNDVKGMSADDVRALVMGPPGTPVTVAAVRPGGNKYVVTLIRSGAGATDADDFVGNLEKETCDEAESMHDELDRLRQLLPRIQALEAENEKLKAEIDALKKLLDQREKELAEAIAKLEPLKSEIAKLNDKVKEQQKEIDDLKALLAKLQQQLKDLQKALDAEKRLTDQLRDQVVRKDAEIAAEKERTAAVKKELEETRAELDRLRKEFAAEMERLRKEHAAEMEKLRKEHAEEVKALKAEIQKLRKEIEDLLARIRELEALLAKMRELEMLLAQERVKNAELKKRLHELEELIAQLEKDLLAARTAAEIAEARAEDLAQRLAAALADVQRLCNAVSKLETQIAGGLGLAIQRTEDASKAQLHTAPVVVKGILESGPAGQSGQFEVGDTIVAVDNKPLRGLRIDEVRFVDFYFLSPCSFFSVWHAFFVRFCSVRVHVFAVYITNCGSSLCCCHTYTYSNTYIHAMNKHRCNLSSWGQQARQ